MSMLILLRIYLKKKYGYIRSTAWSDILTVAVKYRYPSIYIKKDGENFTFTHKDLEDDFGSSEILTVDSNREDLQNPNNNSTVFSQFNFEETFIEEEAPEISIHTDFQNPHKSSPLKFYESAHTEILNYDRLVNTTTSDLSRKTIGSGLENRSPIHSPPNTSSIFQLSPFERGGSGSSEDESSKPVLDNRDRDGRFSFFHSQPKFLSNPIVIPEINS